MHPLILVLISISHLAVTEIEGKVIKEIFEVKYHSGSPDGVFKEKILGINGQFPGPTIQAELGDILEIDVINNIQDGQNTSIHWHGIHLKGFIFEDGTNMVTQCPLRNGHTQRYSFPLHQAGTYWYHSHVNSQYTEGLWGALIVHNKPEVYTYDDEILLTLSDWYHRTALENEEWHLSAPSRGVPPYPDSGMINGLGRYPCTPFASLQNRTCNSTLQKRHVFKVQANKAYRVRVINTSSVAAFNFSIDGHRLMTIEVDGTDVAKPVLTDIASIAAGQRYSFLIQTDKPIGRYLIRANLRKEMLMLIDGVNINKYPEALMGDVTAVIEYSPTSSKLVETYTESHSFEDIVPPMTMIDTEHLDENELSPYDGNHAPPYFDQEFILNIDFYEDHENIRRGSFNRTPMFLPNDKPLMMSLLDGDEIPQEAFPLRIEYMNVIQLVINNPFFGPHPIHLHGHSFWVLGTGGWYDGDYHKDKHNLTLTGAKRDTALLQEQSWIVIRFVADNPGVWTFHCHIDWHALSGMSLTFIEAPELARKQINMTEEARHVCDPSYRSNDSFSISSNTTEIFMLSMTSLQIFFQFIFNHSIGNFF